ncbi:translation initiation factor IF-2-like protein [Leptotrombidium deliense]|uniref:Translation initiation factor IF-2-like protein n=1 Tax=Leptotrombidium deliense TaxID=299467 RepID=A0A443SQX9_9ACAR|nr:translation initiation factor IF-2-like protein [Leptotrombidium deliense]
MSLGRLSVHKSCCFSLASLALLFPRNFSSKTHKLPVIKIWNGMNLSEFRSAVNVTESQLREAMYNAKIKRLDSIEDAKTLVQLLQRRFDVVATPKKIITEHDDLSSIIEKNITHSGKTIRRRPAVVTIMGHVDHGKTTLLDALRHSELVKQEFGGITQHIGAFVVTLNDERLTVLDTPGHSAFASMRQRGANVTDIIVLVVAADDGVMQQTIESINFAKAASVPVIVAISKIDKVNDLNEKLQFVKSGLFAQGIILEEDGGDTQAIAINALKGQGLDELKESIIALAEMLQLKAPIDGRVEGTVIESCVHPHRGRLATVLVQSGTLRKGDVIIAGETNIAFAKVRSMFDERGTVVEKVSPGTPVQVIGWKIDTLPAAGDKVLQVPTEKHAKDIFRVAENITKARKTEEEYNKYLIHSQVERQAYKEELEAKRAAGIRYKRKSMGNRQKQFEVDEAEENKNLHLIIKADVNGTLEVLLNILDSYPNDSQEVKVHVIHSAVGAVTENDVDLASCFKNTYIYAFNVNTLPDAANLSNKSSIAIRNFKVIYKLIDDLKKEISDRLPKTEVEEVVGEAVVLQEFLINEKNKKVPVAGCRCISGFLKKDMLFKLKRGGNIIKENLQLISMRHIKDEVTTIKKEMECGLRFQMKQEDNIHFQHTDSILCYHLKKVNQTTNWNPEGF